VPVELTEDLLLDVGDAIGIAEHSLVEKDFHVTQILAGLSNFQSDFFFLIFAGGTCLSKTVAELERMSEDIDLKLVPTEAGLKLSGNARRSALRGVKIGISAIIESCGYQYKIIKQENNNQHIEWEVYCENITTQTDALRPNIQVETTYCEQFDEYIDFQFGSLVAYITGSELEVESMPCVSATYTAAEKLVAILRRTAGINRGLPWDDDRLIRHVYDIHVLVVHEVIDYEAIIEIIEGVIEWDGSRFSNKHPEFQDDPLAECDSSLIALSDNPIHAENYANFLNPLVYSTTAEQDFQVALSSVSNLYQYFCKHQTAF